MSWPPPFDLSHYSQQYSTGLQPQQDPQNRSDVAFPVPAAGLGVGVGVGTMDTQQPHDQMNQNHPLESHLRLQAQLQAQPQQQHYQQHGHLQQQQSQQQSPQHQQHHYLQQPQQQFIQPQHHQSPQAQFYARLPQTQTPQSHPYGQNGYGIGSYGSLPLMQPMQAAVPLQPQAPHPSLQVSPQQQLQQQQVQQQLQQQQHQQRLQQQQQHHHQLQQQAQRQSRILLQQKIQRQREQETEKQRRASEELEQHNRQLEHLKNQQKPDQQQQVHPAIQQIQLFQQQQQQIHQHQQQQVYQHLNYARQHQPSVNQHARPVNADYDRVNFAGVSAASAVATGALNGEFSDDANRAGASATRLAGAANLFPAAGLVRPDRMGQQPVMPSSQAGYLEQSSNSTFPTRQYGSYDQTPTGQSTVAAAQPQSRPELALLNQPVPLQRPIYTSDHHDSASQGLNPASSSNSVGSGYGASQQVFSHDPMGASFTPLAASTVASLPISNGPVGTIDPSATISSYNRQNGGYSVGIPAGTINLSAMTTLAVTPSPSRLPMSRTAETTPTFASTRTITGPTSAATTPSWTGETTRVDGPRGLTTPTTRAEAGPAATLPAAMPTPTATTTATPPAPTPLTTPTVDSQVSTPRPLAGGTTTTMPPPPGPSVASTKSSVKSGPHSSTQVKVAMPKLAQLKAPAPIPRRDGAGSTGTPTVTAVPAGQSPVVNRTKSNKLAAMSGAGGTIGTTRLAAPDVNYPALLVTLSDEYVRAAHAIVAQARRPGNLSRVESDEYNKLIATALACLDGLLKRFRLSPRAEAGLRLKYATLLFVETESWFEIESTLSKGIVLAERSKLTDLRYTMHHLLVRTLFRIQPRAAIKALDKCIQEVELCKDIAWIYAFRFLRACLGFQSGSLSDHNAGLACLKSARETAARMGDHAVVVAAAAFEAIGHLHSKSADCVQHVQQAIAIARSHQMNAAVAGQQQIWSFLDVVDLSSCLQQSQRAVARQKLDRLQKGLDRLSSLADGPTEVITIPISSCSHRAVGLLDDGFGIFSPPRTTSPDDRTEKDAVGLSFSWLTSDDLYVLGYYLSGLTMDIHNMNDKRAEAYLVQALQILDDQEVGSPTGPDPDSRQVENKPAFGTILHRLRWKTSLRWHILLHQTFSACRREDYELASRLLERLHQLDKPGSQSPLFTYGRNPDYIAQWVTFVEAMIDQGCGRHEKAVELFKSPVLSISDLFNRSKSGYGFGGQSQQSTNMTDSTSMVASPPLGSASSSTVIQGTATSVSAGSNVSGIGPHVDLRLLAALHVLLIDPNQGAEWKDQFHQLEPIYICHSNQSLSTAFYYVQCLTLPYSLTDLKSNLHTALRQAMEVSNNQLLLIGLSLLCTRFYVDLEGSVAEKTAGTVHAAASGGSIMWMAVSWHIKALIMERLSKMDLAMSARSEAAGLLDKLPECVKDRLQVGVGEAPGPSG